MLHHLPDYRHIFLSVGSASVGKHSLHEVSTDNGRRLADWESSRGVVISSTYFPHPKIHKATWISPDQRTKNQIDHIAVDARHASNVLDVRTFRGANVDSDHFLVMAKIRSRISTPKLKRDRVSSANTTRDALKQQDLSKKFSEEISRKLRSISTDSTTGSGHWELCLNVILDTVKELLNVRIPYKC